MIKEQRVFPRHDSQCPVYYTFLASNERYSGECVNISNSGILLECDQPLKPESAIQICLLSGQENSLPLNMLVKVNWQNKQRTGRYHAGASIKAIIAMHDSENA